MTNAVSKVMAMGFLVAMQAGAESANKIQVCVNAGNDTPQIVLLRAEALTSRMLATAGVAVKWHSDGCPARDAIIIDFTSGKPSSHHPDALAYAQVYESVHIVVLFDRVQSAAGGSIRLCSILAHVMTHEITHLLEGVGRHSATGVMKAHWSPKDFDLMESGCLPFASEDLLLIRLSMERRASGLAAAALTDTAAPR